MSSVNYDNLNSSPSWMPYVSFSCLAALPRTSSTVVNESGESGFSLLDPDLRKFQLFPIQYYISCWLILDGSYYVEGHSFSI
jgi:hypothetical protein